MVSTELLTPSDVQGSIVRPASPNGLGVIVLTGSSGRIDGARAQLFAELGATALALRWWGGEAQPPGVNLVPLETFTRGIDFLRTEGCTRFALLGVSFGAEAALLAAAHDRRVNFVIAISPTHVVWQNSGPGLDGSSWPPRSSFTYSGRPLPFIVWDPRVWPPAGTRDPVYRPMYEQSLKTFAEDVPAATIPVEQSQAEIILVAGKADALWPSDTSAHMIVERLGKHGRQAILVEHAGAGHMPLFPGEADRSPPPDRAWGGTRAADRELGKVAWETVINRLGLS